MTNAETPEGPSAQPSRPVPSMSGMVPGSTMPSYRPPIDRSVPKLGRGLVWSDLVREMEEEHAARLRARTNETIVPLRPSPYNPNDGVDGIEEAA